MIQVENFGKAVRITGSADQIAMEFEVITKEVRNAFSKILGEEAGNDLYGITLSYAEMDEDERDRCAKAELDRAKEENPQLFREFQKHLQAISAGSTGSGQAEVHTQK